jgi:hypothetical protein
MRAFAPFLIVPIVLVLLPVMGGAQTGAALTGIVTDSSGAVLPGVIVEARSPALIEQVRSSITDEAGRYRIVDLRPGAYTVTFTLPGFSSVLREGIELSGTFVANVDAELRVGGLQETVTVTGETPVVDTQTTQARETLTNDVLSSIPTGRQYYSITQLVPALNVQGSDVGGVQGPIFSVFQAHGGRRNEGVVQVEGLSAGFQGMGVSFYVPDVGTAQEVNFNVLGGLGEAATGGPVMNILPKVGGNTFSGTVFVNGAAAGFQGSNYTTALQNSGLRAPNKLRSLWDANTAFGGPIKKDKLWFYWTGRHQGNRKYVAGMFRNKNAGDLTKWTYDPDLSHQAVDDGTWRNSSLRLTWQVSQRNKLNFWWDEQDACQHCSEGGTATISPEATARVEGHPQQMGQITWNSQVSNKLVLDAAYGLGPRIQWGGNERPDNNRKLTQVTEQAGIIPGLVYRASDWSRPWGNTHTWRGSASYVTGAHNLKVGASYALHMALFANFYNDSSLHYQFRNGVPNQFTMFGLNGVRRRTDMGITALYVQDQWTLGRLTLQGGLRFEHYGSHFPDQQIGPTLFIPNPIKFPAQDGGVSAKDISPRFGFAYDLFGKGKTALRASAGRYPTPENSFGIYGDSQNPVTRFAGQTNRSWNNFEGDFVPHCDLLNPAANGTMANGAFECGPWSNQSFGKIAPSTSYDPKVLNGWNIREYTWDFDVSVQHEIAPRVAVTAGYVRRIWGNFTVTHNRAVGPGDFDQFTVTAPADPRLPGGGNYALTAYDVKPAKFGLTDNYVTFASNYGNQTEHYNGFDFDVNARMRRFTVVGGLTTGQKMTNNCDIVAQLPETLLGPVRQPKEFCNLQTPFLTQVKGLTTYSLPWLGVQLSGTFQSKPTVGANAPSIASESLAANWVVLTSQIAPSLQRNLSGGATNTLVNIVKPGSLYGERLNQFDVRIAKTLRRERTRTNIAVDVYNVFNSNTADAYQQTYGSSWLVPTSILPARFAKLGVQFDF